MAVGIGYRREMTAWDLSQVAASFFEVCPENWIRRDRTRLHEMTAAGRDVRLHGVSLNLGGTGPISTSFLYQVRDLMRELGATHYSDHLAASGDAHQLYELFPIPFTRVEAQRVADRVAQVQDVLGFAIAVENSTYYTNVGDLRESEFLQEVVARSNCRVLLDVNNIVVNWKTIKWNRRTITSRMWTCPRSVTSMWPAMSTTHDSRCMWTPTARMSSPKPSAWPRPCRRSVAKIFCWSGTTMCPPLQRSIGGLHV